MTGNHDYTKAGFDLFVSMIVLEDGVWIGARSVVCPGVVCETHAVLTANSVATQNLSAYKIYQGNPALFIKERVIG
jgi:putative colanic acid biosynthesis acetyltransferase WcaF